LPSRETRAAWDMLEYTRHQDYQREELIRIIEKLG
jgi:hypothetical protein